MSIILNRATPETWFELRHVGDGITYIYEPHIKEFYRCNVWHVRGRDDDMVVDSGMGVVNLRERIALLAERNCLAVATHTHFDHIGSHHEFKDRLVHRDEARLLANPTRRETLVDQYVVDDIFTALPPFPYQSEQYSVQSAPPTRLLSDGDVIDLGDRSFEVIHTPGHSPGGISLFEAATGILFSGDVVYDGPLVDDAYHSDKADYIASMKRLLDLPVQVVHGGHFPSFGRQRFIELIVGWLAEHDR
jgi:glyoxylase-like metal-dependent hydrolase (beta-lactamase superfamily II)